jgi:uncharacterized protein YecE (DUF72 family)
MNLHVGTSGYAYKEWKGSFYPEKLPQKDMLSFYADNFNSVEINNTFYHMPSEKVLVNWAGAVGENFQFVLKASRRITHFKRLKETEEELNYLLTTSRVLGAKLGPTLFQLPPNMKKDVERLGAFLKTMPRKWRAAFEFRHDSWFDDEVAALLSDHGAALVSVETEDTMEVPFFATSDWGYLRLRKMTYENSELQNWVQRINQQHWSDAFVFFKHEDEATGPKLAKRFHAAWE